MWFVALQPGQEHSCDCFDHADNIVHMGKTIAQKGAHVVKDGVRHKDIYATAVGDITKAYFFIDISKDIFFNHSLIYFRNFLLIFFLIYLLIFLPDNFKKYFDLFSEILF